MIKSTIEGFRSSRRVTIDSVELSPAESLKLINHSPDGFNWGYGGSGPAQLALALLLRYADEDFAVEFHQEFKWDVIANLPANFTMPAGRVTRWISKRDTKVRLVSEPSLYYETLDEPPRSELMLSDDE